MPQRAVALALSPVLLFLAYYTQDLLAVSVLALLFSLWYLIFGCSNIPGD